MTSSEGTQRTAPATTLATLLAELDAGDSVALCFLFDEPQDGGDCAGLNGSVHILHQMPVGGQIVIAGVRKVESVSTYVTLTIDRSTGNGHAKFGADLSDEDLYVVEVSFAAVNETTAAKSAVE